ncbi:MULTISPECIES: hypothetical protein [Chitinophagaceae]
MIQMELTPDFRPVTSRQNAFILPTLVFVALVWIVLILKNIIHFASSQDKNTFLIENGTGALLFIIFSIVAITIFGILIVKHEPFYTHLIVNEEGLTYFNKYQFRPSKVIPWKAIQFSPAKYNKNSRDIYMRHQLIGIPEVVFWYENNGKVRILKENFGGYRWLPFLYKNPKTLRNTFVKGILIFRKDLRIDPKLVRDIFVVV